MNTNDRKFFILDTSVLLYDKKSIHSFPGNDVIIPLVVLDEIDTFKDRSGILGENARYVNRFLDDLRSIGTLYKGVEVPDKQTIRVEINLMDKVPEGLDPKHADNRIISVARELSKNKDNEVIVITKDINFRVKCDALEIKSSDYYKDRIVEEKSQVYNGQIEINIDHDTIDEFFLNKKIPIDGKISIDGIAPSLFPNQLVVGKSGKQSMLGIVREKFIEQLQDDLHDLTPISPRNKEQKFAVDLLTRESIPLVSISGIAGSGKTFLTLMSGLSGIQSNRYERIIITRSLQPVGNGIGFLPGDIRDKVDPWMGSISDNFRHYFKDMTYFEIMREKGQIEIIPLAFIRGRTFNNTFLIVDEAQNSTIHELKTVITRMGENSKIVLLGDIDQIDTPYLDSLSNGLTVIIEKLKSKNLTGHITLLKGERSELATLVSKVI